MQTNTRNIANTVEINSLMHVCNSAVLLQDPLHLILVSDVI